MAAWSPAAGGVVAPAADGVVAAGVVAAVAGASAPQATVEQATAASAASRRIRLSITSDSLGVAREFVGSATAASRATTMATGSRAPWLTAGGAALLRWPGVTSARAVWRRTLGTRARSGVVGRGRHDDCAAI